MVNEKSILTKRSETFHEMRLLAEKALLNYIKEKKINQTSIIRSIGFFDMKIQREGVEVYIPQKKGKCGIVEATFSYSYNKDGTINFDKNSVQIKEF